MRVENAIELHDVTKKFKVFFDKGHTLKELTLFSMRRKYEERVVLNCISFEIKKGEAVGLIGHNGCGKSTTLKLLTKIMYPDTGTVEMRGRVSSLIELGAGFHPDMSGRQNIYTNASIFGLTRKEIEARLDEIISFSELEEFIDNPVRTYSSGMYMRLAFSVAINVDADILLIDEILAVGDSNFQAKCLNKLRSIKSKGTTIVIVSHSLGQIEQICDRTLWIDNGKIKLDGHPGRVHAEYLHFMEQQRKAVAVIKERERLGNGYARIEQVQLLDMSDCEVVEIKYADSVKLKIQYKVIKTVFRPVIEISVIRNDGICCYKTNTHIENYHFADLEEGGLWEVMLDNVPLLDGEYFISVMIETVEGVIVDYVSEAVRFVVKSNFLDLGICRIQHHWNIEKESKV